MSTDQVITCEAIVEKLDEIERAHEVRVLFACESGSRAWGFESSDSDYDVRFIYVRPVDWYLSIDIAARRDVIEEPISDLLDVSGWDLAKTLQLYRKSNPPLYEWLGSPIVYLDRLGLADRMRDLARDYYCDKAAAYHYLRMTQNNYRSYLQRDSVRTKKYLYALRPLLAVIWIERGLGVVPTEFQTLVETVIDEAGLRDATADLLVRKRAGTEMGEGPPIPVIHEYLRHHLDRMEDALQELPAPRGVMEPLNTLFRETLQAAWRATA